VRVIVILLHISSDVIYEEVFEMIIQINIDMIIIGIGDKTVTICLMNSYLIDRSSLLQSSRSKHSIEMKLEDTFEAT
jgi:hypothetical protein